MRVIDPDGRHESVVPYVESEAPKGEMPLLGSPKCIDIGGWQRCEMSRSRLMSRRKKHFVFVKNGDRHESEMLSVRAGKRMDDRPQSFNDQGVTPTTGKQHGDL